MVMRVGENWDLTAEQHLARAEEILRDRPRPGDLMMYVQEATLAADRHVVLARLKMTREEMTRVDAKQVRGVADFLTGLAELSAKTGVQIEHYEDILLRIDGTDKTVKMSGTLIPQRGHIVEAVE